MAEESCQGAGTAPGAGDAHSTAPAHCNPPRDLHEAKREMLGSSPSSASAVLVSGIMLNSVRECCAFSKHRE